MIKPGLVSVTLREYSPAEVVALAQRAGLQGIEWGGDVHVPHGDLPRARQVRDLTRNAALQTVAYGSYYRVGHSENATLPAPQRLPFARVLETAVELGAPLIRVWAGIKSSAEADEDDRSCVVADAQRIAETAAEAGIVVALEYHGGTLTDTPQSALDVLRRVAHPNLKTLWQPIGEPSVEARRAALQQVLPWLANLHVYHWPQGERRPLREGQSDWLRYLQIAASTERPHWALLEFVRDNAQGALLEDARTLRQWLNSDTPIAETASA